MGDNRTKREAELALIRDVAAKCKTAVITGPAGARWLGLSTLGWVTRVDLALPGNARTWGKAYPDRIYRGGVIRPEEYCVYQGLRTATAVRAMFDSYRYYGRMEALAQLESARWQHPKLTAEYLLEQTTLLPQAKGLRHFRELIGFSADTSESVLETIVRDRLLRAIADGRLRGVHSIEFQVGFKIEDAHGAPTAAWADALINGFIVVEADGAEKSSGTAAQVANAIDVERFREKQLQNLGGVFYRVGWEQARGDAFIGRLQRLIDAHPGARHMDNRLTETRREWLDGLRQRFA